MYNLQGKLGDRSLQKKLGIMDLAVPNLACYALHNASVRSHHTHPGAVPQRHTKATTTPLALSYENKTLSNNWAGLMLF